MHVELCGGYFSAGSDSLRNAFIYRNIADNGGCEIALNLVGQGNNNLPFSNPALKKGFVCTYPGVDC